MRTIIYVLSIALLLLSCNDKESLQKVNYDETAVNDSLTMEQILKDTTKVLMAELPVYFDSTKVLISPVGLMDISKNKYPKRKR